MIISHEHPAYHRGRSGRWNGAYYYSVEIVKNIIPLVKTDRPWITINIPEAGAADRAIVFIHNNLHPEMYDWLKDYKDLILVCGIPETVEKMQHLGKAVYLPLSVDVAEVEKYAREKTRDVAFAGRRPKRKGIAFPKNTVYLEGMPREQLLHEIATFRYIFAVGRTAIEAKILGCTLLSYDPRFPDPSRWEVLDNRDAAKILQRLIDKEDKMAVKVGHARISETGQIYGKKGDQTGTEVCVTNWVNPGWKYVAIHPDPEVRERHAQNVEKACANDNVGYNQYTRNTLYAEYKKTKDLAKVAPCDTDCSELQNVAAVAAGTPNVTHGANGWTTSTMREALEAAGYKIVTKNLTADYAVRGAIYVKPGEHTVCALTNGPKAAEQLKAAGISVPASGNMAYVGKGIGEGTALQSMAVRTGAGTNYAHIGDVPAGAKVEVLEFLANGWMNIVWPGCAEGQAYTSNREGKYYKTKFYGKKGKVVECSHLYVRKTPGGTPVGILDKGDEVIITEQDGKWYHIVSPKSGWSSSKFIEC